MEPIFPDNLNPNPGGLPPDSASGRRSRKRWWLVIAAAIVAIIVLAGIIIFVSGRDSNRDDGQKANVYHDRAGFDRSQLTKTIGDPAPLITKAGSDTPAAYKGVAVVQSCNILTVEDIRKLGLLLAPNSTTAIERNYIDGQTQGDVRAFPTSLASADDSNSCAYPFYEPQGTGVTVEVYQPPYNSPDAINYELSRQYQPSGNIEGYPQYVQEVEGRTYYLLRDGNSAVRISLRKLTDDRLTQKIVAAVAANYKRETAAPKGPLHFAYDSPIFKKDYLNSCEIMAARDAETLFGGPAKPFLREQIATATGVIQYHAQDSSSAFSNIRHACTRQAVSNGFSNKKSLTVETESFLSEEAAKLQMASGRQLDDGVVSVPAAVGDDAYFSQTTGENPELTVRQGRFVMSFSLLDQTKPNMTDQEMIQALTPVAQAAAAKTRTSD